MNKKFHEKEGSATINKWHIVFISVNLLALDFPSFPLPVSQTSHMFPGLPKLTNLIITLSHSVLCYIFLGIV